jgi:hypothetical protein
MYSFKEENTSNSDLFFKNSAKQGKKVSLDDLAERTVTAVFYLLRCGKLCA